MQTISTNRWPIYIKGLQAAKTPCLLLETGRIHNTTDAYFYGDGASTLLFANQACIDMVYSIDHDPESEAKAKYILGRAADRVKFINENSMHAIPALNGMKFGIILLDSAEDEILNVWELVLCADNGLIDNNTVILLDDIQTKSKHIMSIIHTYGKIIDQNDRCAAITIHNLNDMIKYLKHEILGDL